MSDGMTDAAAMYRQKALKEAKEKYPNREIAERNWTKHHDWDNQKMLYMASIINLLVGDKKNLKKCGQCQGEGKEKVIYVHEKWLKHDREEVEWCCRKCYGVGFVRNDT